MGQVKQQFMAETMDDMGEGKSRPNTYSVDGDNNFEPDTIDFAINEINNALKLVEAEPVVRQGQYLPQIRNFRVRLTRIIDKNMRPKRLNDSSGSDMWPDTSPNAKERVK